MTDRIRLEEIEHRHFKGMKGECFRFVLGKRKAEGELVGVTHHGSDAAPGAARDPFSLVFKLDEGVATRAGVHRVEHEKFEPMELLVTPLQPDKKASYFEIVFG